MTGEQLAFVSQPGAAGAVAGEPFAVTVAVVDSQGNTLPSAAPITLSLVGPGTPGDRVLRGPGLIVAASGRATFAGLAVHAPGRYRLVARTAGLTDRTSLDFDVQPLRGSGDFAAARLAAGSGCVATLLQEPTPGTFRTGPVWGAGQGPSWLELSDLDRDGRVDMASPGLDAGELAVLRGR